PLIIVVHFPHFLSCACIITPARHNVKYILLYVQQKRPGVNRGVYSQRLARDGVYPLAGAEPGQAEEDLAEVVQADADVDGGDAEAEYKAAEGCGGQADAVERADVANKAVAHVPAPAEYADDVAEV